MTHIPESGGKISIYVTTNLMALKNTIKTTVATAELYFQKILMSLAPTDYTTSTCMHYLTNDTVKKFQLTLTNASYYQKALTVI